MSAKIDKIFNNQKKTVNFAFEIVRICRQIIILPA
jgi:hypothetical protein